MSKKEKNLYDPKKLLALIKKENSKTKLKIKKIKCKCNHQGKNEKLWVRPTKSDQAVLVCRECRSKIDLNGFGNKDADEIKQDIKSCGKEFINWINIAKIQMSPKNDADELKFLGDVQYGIYRAMKLLKAYIGDGFEVHKKNKKNKKKGKKGKKSRTYTGGRSMRFRN